MLQHDLSAMLHFIEGTLLGTTALRQCVFVPTYMNVHKTATTLKLCEHVFGCGLQFVEGFCV